MTCVRDVIFMVFGRFPAFSSLVFPLYSCLQWGKIVFFPGFRFIFARAVNGPPPPVAVKRLRVSDLPTTITLSDADAMVPQFRMSLFPEITVSARISKSGQPTAQSGDFQSAVAPAKSNQTETIKLTITDMID